MKHLLFDGKMIITIIAVPYCKLRLKKYFMYPQPITSKDNNILPHLRVGNTFLIKG